MAIRPVHTIWLATPWRATRIGLGSRHQAATQLRLKHRAAIRVPLLPTRSLGYHQPTVGHLVCLNRRIRRTLQLETVAFQRCPQAIAPAPLMQCHRRVACPMLCLPLINRQILLADLPSPHKRIRVLVRTDLAALVVRQAMTFPIRDPAAQAFRLVCQTQPTVHRLRIACIDRICLLRFGRHRRYLSRGPRTSAFFVCIADMSWNGILKDTFHAQASLRKNREMSYQFCERC